ncbi:hypothetical protein LTR27_007461 [Elasticomyces elasticus]|nr:hypothetical protein LTR27_007461 [Elasticomyces elasticus]
MVDHAPSRFVALPAELRVRIYECLFEDESPQGEIDISLVKDHAPTVAIVAVSRLTRREALEMAEQAVPQFFSNHKFFLDIHSPVTNTGQYHTGPHGFQNAVKSLPKLPISGFELRFNVALVDWVGSNHTYVRLAASYDEPGSRIVNYRALDSGGSCTYGNFEVNALRPGVLKKHVAIGHGEAFHCCVVDVAEAFFDELWPRQSVD